MPELPKGFTGAQLSYMLSKFYSHGQGTLMHTLSGSNKGSSGWSLICTDIPSLQTLNLKIGQRQRSLGLSSYFFSIIMYFVFIERLDFLSF